MIRLLGNGSSPKSGLIDTSVVIDLGSVDVARLPVNVVVSALTLAELARGPAMARSAAARAHRLELTQIVKSRFEVLPFDPTCACSYGQVCSAVVAVGRKPGGTRAIDLMIAATALAKGLPLYTFNAADLVGLEDLIEIVDLDQVPG